MAEPALEGAYRDGHELERDVNALIVSLRACHGQQALAVEAGWDRQRPSTKNASRP